LRSNLQIPIEFFGHRRHDHRLLPDLTEGKRRVPGPLS
jgi:hypothetical protein